MTIRRFRTYHDVADPAREDVLLQVADQAQRLARRLAAVRRVVVIASGKGGVGKSAITANVAAALASRGRSVGAADADLNGPSLARMLAAHGQTLAVTDDGLEPAHGVAGVRVMSMDLLLATDDAPLRWRGPAAPEFLWQSTLEGGTLREFIADVRWGELDYLLIDAPPGTDKLTRLLQLLPRTDVVLLVTTPSRVSRFIVGKSARLAREAMAAAGQDLERGALGLVVNMSAHVCEACGHRSPLFEEDVDGDADLRSSCWAEIPFDRRLAVTTDLGAPYVLERPDAPAARALRALAERIDGHTTSQR